MIHRASRPHASSTTCHAEKSMLNVEQQNTRRAKRWTKNCTAIGIPPSPLADLYPNPDSKRGVKGFSHNFKDRNFQHTNTPPQRLAQLVNVAVSAHQQVSKSAQFVTIWLLQRRCRAVYTRRRLYYLKINISYTCQWSWTSFDGYTMSKFLCQRTASPFQHFYIPF